MHQPERSIIRHFSRKGLSYQIVGGESVTGLGKFSFIGTQCCKRAIWRPSRQSSPIEFE